MGPTTGISRWNASVSGTGRGEYPKGRFPSIASADPRNARPRYGHSDVVPTTLSLPLLTHALHKALKSEFEDANGNANEPSSGHGNDSAPAMGPFMLISTGYGALVSRHFASTFPDLVHSHLLIDSETPTSWYGELDSGGQAHPKVSAKAGLRGGYGAPGHTGIGLFLFDVLPTILEPLGITRIMGLVAGFRARDRLLAAWGHGGATWGDAGGGGWRLRSAGGANAGLLATSLSERLDANAGPSSMNYRALNDGSFPSHRPTAVLSSFWKLHADEAGWGDEQRQTIAGPAKDKGALVGWWRVGSRTGKDDGGDRGAAEGICAEERGRVWCEEAVRKLIVAGDLE